MNVFPAMVETQLLLETGNVVKILQQSSETLVVSLNEVPHVTNKKVFAAFVAVKQLLAKKTLDLQY